MKFNNQNMNTLAFITLAVGVLLVLLMPWLLTLPAVTCIGFDKNTDSVGDTIGGCTAPVIGLISAILVYLTLKEQIKFNEKQIENAEEEQFRASIFHMFDVLRGLKNEIAIDNGEDFNVSEPCPKGGSKADTIKGRPVGAECFNVAMRDLAHLVNCINAVPYTSNEQLSPMLSLIFVHEYYKRFGFNANVHKRIKEMEKAEKLQAIYRLFYVRYDEFGNYFRYLYHILKRIRDKEEEAIRDGNKKEDMYKRYHEYAQILQAQMGYNELILLYYDSMDYPKMRELITHYDFLDNLPKGLLLADDPEVHIVPEYGIKLHE